MLVLTLIFGFANAQITSNLPIVIISTPNTIGANQVQATMNIIDNASGVNSENDPPTFTGMIGIKLRGNNALPKLSYSVETWSSPTISLDTSLMKLPRDNDWVLLGNYYDRSLMRNVLAFKLHDKMGRYAPRMVHCELILNNQYLGVYCFGEQIKRDVNRLDIAKLTVADNFGLNMTGGYIWELGKNSINGWQSSYNPPYATFQKVNFKYNYPDNNDITNAQKAYIKSYVDSFENEMNAANFQDTLLGWRRHGANNSFIDYMIIQEISKNYDGYRDNVFFYKDKGTKMRPGPLWGHDLSWRNTSNCNSSKDTGWVYHIGGVCGSDTMLAPSWWKKLSTDTLYMKDLKCRYSEFRKPGNVLDTVEIFKIIDSVANRLNANGAITRNFNKWPIWGVSLVNEPTPMAPDYATEVNNMKQFIRTRLAWLDPIWQGVNCPAPVSIVEKTLDATCSIYPNPASSYMMIELQNANTYNTKITLQNLQGQKVYEIQKANLRNEINTSKLPSGVYFVTIKTGKELLVRKVVIE